MRNALRADVFALVLAFVIFPSDSRQHLRAQQPGLDELLDRTQRYAAHYADVFANVVTEEHFVQDLYPRLTLSNRPSGAHRELRSELTLVSVGGAMQWRPFRDVYEVDGRPVRDRDARLVRLFSQSNVASDPLEQAALIAQESSRYNLGTVRRTVNVPGLPLLFVQHSLRQRFNFSLDKSDGDGSWIVKFEERARPTLFKGDDGVDAPSTGRLWIRGATGAIRRTEHVIAQPFVSARFMTEFAPSNRFDVEAPIKLVEEYGLPNARLTGTATYTNLRQFSVSVAEHSPSEKPTK